MPDNASASSAPKKRGRHPKNKAAEVNTSQEVTNEFCTMNSSLAYTYSYFGLNIFDLYSQEQLADLVRDPIANNEILRELSMILYGTNGAFTNTVDYMTAMPTLDKVIVTHGRSKNKKKQNKELMESVLRTIRDKEVIRDALFRGMIEGLAFYYFETTTTPASRQKFMTDYDVDSVMEINELGVNASIVSLPTKYTKIVGRKNSSYVIAFNLDYFDIADGESREKKLRKYPKEIREAYERRDKEVTNGNWVVLDSSKTIVHKIRSKREEPYGRPIVLAAISDILYGDYFTQTKRNVLDEINNRIVYMTFPEGKEKGTSALTKTQQEKQHNAVKGAVRNKNNRGGISFFSVASGTKISAIDTQNTDIFDDKYESNLNDKISLDLGIAGSLLNGVGSGTYSAQQNNLELLSAQLFQWIEQISAELNKCISANIIKDSKNWVECKYLPITHVNKKEMVGYMKDLWLQAGGSMSAYIASCGISPDAYYALLDEEIENGIYEKYKPHATSYTMSGEENAGGRPETDNPTENTVKSQANNGNSIPSPSDK